jgi:hypothetical protein
VTRGDKKILWYFAIVTAALWLGGVIRPQTVANP